jgi:Ca-activated chloride channel family protein
LLLAGFRRGWLAAVVLLLAIMPMPRAEAAGHDWWSGLWQRDDQRAYQALQHNQAASARAFARSPLLAAAADYRAGDYAAAAQRWSRDGSADANYNRGNALIRMKQYPQAIQAYNRSLALHPGMRDAIANRALAQQLLRKQQREQAQRQAEQAKDHRGNQSGAGQAQPGQQQQGQQQQGQQQQGQQQQGQQQQGQQQQGQQPQGQQPQGQQPQGQQQQGQQPQGQQQQGRQQSERDQGPVAPTDMAAQRQRQAQADAAAKRALQQALQSRQAQQGKPGDNKTRVPAESAAQREQRDAIEQWLRQVPDDPGGLLRRKFAVEYQRRQAQGGQ